MNWKLEAIKQHVKDNKTPYLIGAGCLVAGITIGVVFKRRPTNIINMVAPEINNKPVFTPVFNNMVNNGGYMRKIVRCLETDEMWPSVSKAAQHAGSSLQKMSQHINGHKGHINGLHYVIEGLASGAASQ
jgi:hypothetical protein